MLLSLKPQRCVALAALLLGACASQSESLAPTITSALPSGETVSKLPPPGGYQLTDADLELDCRKLTGRMAVRIVQIRDFQTRRQTTALSRGIQSATTPVFGGTSVGADPDGRYARDRAQLEAYNKRLEEKKCPSFDLEAELNPAAKDPPRTRLVKQP
ncbi:hypothetical protein [Hyphomicrobium zavarzinii]|jgi:hypothetical protein|uniref:hypothetical protein n=1 Tax=Hyphomicrobium zavarzinii TaxID=48292 RepID=UPI0012EB4DCC|nr:hypothetical protein [Hyphomicrobium zavarzinii]